METEGFLYETLSPLSATAATLPPPSTEYSEPYVIFRNQISLSSAPLPPSVSAATDYFSLDVNADEDETNAALSSNLVNAETPVQTPQPERTLEGGWFRSNCRFKSPILQLHKEILDFCDFLSPTQEEQDSRNAAVESVSDVIKYIWPNSKVEVFGSFKTGLYLPSSDIDAVILGSDIKTPQIGLQALSRALSQKGIAKKIQVIAKARVPIIKFIEKRSGISFDISFDLQNGPKAAEYIQGAISNWPPLRPLCLILKVFLQQRELNEVYSGGIGSYALLAMLIAVFRNLRDNQASSEHNLGVLLVNFFDIYGRKLNTLDVGVSCNGTGTFFFKKNKGFLIKGRPMLLSIEDPQAPENDIGKSSFNYFQVRSAFAMAYSTLTNSKTIMSLGPARSILGTIIRPDAVLVERKGEVSFNNILPGAGEPLDQHYGDQQQGLFCNWRLDEDEEHPLPRGNNGVTVEHGSGESSGKKRKKSSSSKKSSKKAKENGESGTPKKEKSGKKKKWRHYSKNGGDGGSPWKQQQQQRSG